MSDIQFREQWKRQGILLLVFGAFLGVFYFDSFASMVSVWYRSETFAHGFVVLPISLWLIWRIRERVFAAEPCINYLGIPLLFLLGLFWLLAKYVGIQVAEQLAVVSMIPVVVFTLVGWQVTNLILFPLGFLFFMVPLGEELTPYLINQTADVTVYLVNLVGIPVYREGTFFELPTGSWSVVAACSGVRYLIASLTLGVLYAYLNYSSYTKRSIFILFSIIVPIVANWIRAFMIVMIGHFSGMELATGVDHLIYGWVFFGVVIGLMFYIGSIWRDDAVFSPSKYFACSLGDIPRKAGFSNIVMLILAGTLIAWPLKSHFDKEGIQDLSEFKDVLVRAPDNWLPLDMKEGAWRPSYYSLDKELYSWYQDADGNILAIFIGYYAQQRQGAELSNYNNALVAEGSEAWKAIQGGGILLPSIDVYAPSAEVKGVSNHYFVIYLYYVNGAWVTNKYEAKWQEIKAHFSGRRNDGALVAFISPVENDLERTKKALVSNISSVIGGVEEAIITMQ